MVADFGVVKHLGTWLDVTLNDGGFGEGRQMLHRAFCQHLHRVFHGLQIVFRQMLRIGTRIGQRFVSFVQALRQRERGFGGEAKAAVGFFL